MKTLHWILLFIGAMGAVIALSLWIVLPSVTGLIFAQPITLVSVPFVDYTAAPNGSASNSAAPTIFFLAIALVAGIVIWRKKRGR